MELSETLYVDKNGSLLSLMLCPDMRIIGIFLVMGTRQWIIEGWDD